MTKYKTEKRKANVGERILITDAELEQGDYKNGSVATVSDEKPCIDSLLYVNEWERSVHYSEYEVIVGTKPSKSERISALETEVAVLKAEVEALKQASKPTVQNITISAPQTKDARKLADALSKILAEEPPTRVLETPNQLRWGTIQRAKAFVAKNTSHTEKCGTKYGIPFDMFVVREEFIVDTKKRTVVCLLKGVNSVNVRARGIAKCDPTDVFNADIGKAIALARALGVEVPQEFVKAVQPTEVVVGMTVMSDGSFFGGVLQKVTKLRPDLEKDAFNTDKIGYLTDKDVSITDDTDAVYE